MNTALPSAGLRWRTLSTSTSVELEGELDSAVLEAMRRENGVLVTSGAAFIHAIARMIGALGAVHQATVAGVVMERLGRSPSPATSSRWTDCGGGDRRARRTR